MKHIPVLLKETMKILDIKPNGIYLDLTLGYGGHSQAILKKLNKNGKLIAFDLDQEAIKNNNKLLQKFSNFEIIHSNYKFFDFELKKRNIHKVDGILLDLGVSSPQLDDVKRGFSYNKNAILDMRMDQINNHLTAKFIVNHYPKSSLIRIFKNYGEEKKAFQIANEIINFRQKKTINTTFDLVDIIKKIKKNDKKHPAKNIFQSLRIEVNQEIDNLKELLSKVLFFLNKNAKLVIISFHSLEDRLVKNKFNEVTKNLGNRDDVYVLPDVKKKEFELVNKHVIVPSDEEILQNYRAKSAKLRAIRKI